MEIKLIQLFMHQIFIEHLLYTRFYVSPRNIAEKESCLVSALMKYSDKDTGRHTKGSVNSKENT